MYNECTILILIFSNRKKTLTFLQAGRNVLMMKESIIGIFVPAAYREIDLQKTMLTLLQ